MTDRIQSLTVALTKDVRDDDLDALVAAIKQMRAVADVALGEPVDITDYMARIRVDLEWRDKVLSLLAPAKEASR